MIETMSVIKLKRWFVYLLVLGLLAGVTYSTSFSQHAFAAMVNVVNGIQFTDTNNNVLHAHGGGMIEVGSYYYWIGEHRGGADLVSLYRSPELSTRELRAHVLSES